MIYRLLFRLLLVRFDGERAHRVACALLRGLERTPPAAALIRRFAIPRDPAIAIRALGRTFPSPLGLAAGFDKDARSYEALAMLGFGFVEVGTVTAREQTGREGKRIWRLLDARAMYNRMGFPNPGADVFARRLARRRSETILGVNVGKSKEPLGDVAEDYRYAVRAVASLADFLVVNVSSPNTPGLRRLQEMGPLKELLSGIQRELNDLGARVPLLVKIAPDLADAELDAIADVALELRLDGIVAVNTTIPTPEISERVAGLADVPEGGGLSGAPLKERSLEVLRRLRARAGDRLTLVSVGGIETADDVWERVRSGATLVQAHTGFVYGGPLWPRRLNRDLSALVREAGMASVQSAIGSGTVEVSEERSGPAERSQAGAPLVGRPA